MLLRNPFHFIRAELGSQLACQHKQIVGKAVEILQDERVNRLNFIEMHHEAFGAAADTSGDMTK